MSIKPTALHTLPDTPGVYFFLNKSKKVLYIGKATSLRSRVRSYFTKDIAMVRSPLIAQMVDEAHSIDYRTTDSVLEALILEADLIRKFKPEFNTKEKDDKSFYCVVITDEDFPVIRLIRKKDIDMETMQSAGIPLKYVFGPYPEGTSIKEGLKIIRKIFPYRDEKCRIQVKPKPCFNYHIGLCPGVCIGAVTKKDYARIIRNIQLFFQGKKGALLTLLTKDMNQASAEERFEAAARIRNQIYALEHIRDVSMIKDQGTSTGVRMEAYDIAHMSGKDMVGVMVVMEDGQFNTQEYRKFIIRGYDSSNDTGALRELLMRRRQHSEWRQADIIVIDGGQAQYNVAHEVYGEDKQSGIVCVVKDERHKAREIQGDERYTEKYKKEIIALNAEAHRYAIAFHKKRRNKAFLPQ